MNMVIHPEKESVESTKRRKQLDRSIDRINQRAEEMKPARKR
jgi:hypothetical protein